ncbi:DNA-3-methyladenine glycosylase [Caloranaerobacter azorensis H53214]|uniref:DNA-3-methyladenine glycosylase I n=1 Tax=Caloranaerobacter azorensis H53214 TaxID=1156417 RepID=A0A096BJD1_9FIRM|nr:DNA-3-methyladenine glycosylase I [Caloranaerobacter azorensis]KGG81310.1 DNA-3-methyladenine glycosylase [Caloranaerobacter azorensis H53214]
MKKRCGWVNDDPIYIKYHDEEWGIPIHDDKKLFEFLVLEIFQAGLSWITILKKRDNFRKAFDNFDPVKISKYDEDKIKELMENKGIIRNRKKIEAVINNAKAFLKIQQEFGSFDKYLWQFVDNKPIVNSWADNSLVPSKTKLSEKISTDMKKRSFIFFGPTICYAYMQAVGMVNDHIIGCFKYKS